MVKYKVDVTCVAGVDIDIDQDFWEQDLVIEGKATRTTSTSAPSTPMPELPDRRHPDVHDPRELPYTGLVEDGIEEVYQAVKFEVSSGGGGRRLDRRGAHPADPLGGDSH